VIAFGFVGVGVGHARAQVGSDPENSPYKDIRISQTLSLVTGYLSGGTGVAGVGPSNGPLAGIRWDAFVGGAASVFVEVLGSRLDRNLVKPGDPLSTRNVGTEAQDVFLIDAGLNFIFTGRKTWRGIAPFIGLELGAVIGGNFPSDSLGFTFGSKFQFGPSAGFRFFLNRRVHLRFEIRDTLWRLKYPLVYFNGDLDDEVNPPIIDPRDNNENEWTHHATFMIGLGWTFRL